MKKLLCIAMLILALSDYSGAQNVGVGTTSPDASAQMDVVSTNKGMLIPRMTMAQRDAILTPATGLLIFQTDHEPGFYYYKGTAWTPVSAGSASGWSLTGNAGTNWLTNYVGTTDAQPLAFKVNNSLAGYLGNNANVFFGKGNNISSQIGYSNIGIGSDALNYNIRNNLVAIGDSALFHNGLDVTSVNEASGNTAVGSKALYENTTGYYNTALGFQTLYSNTKGFYNVANGYQALISNTTGGGNTASGFRALYFNTTGFYNTASGFRSLFFNTSGDDNTAIGTWTLHLNTSGVGNNATGMWALYSNTTGSYNAASGHEALYANSTGNSNTAMGHLSLAGNTTGYSNVAIGDAALKNASSQSNLVAIGDSSLFNNAGNFNVAIGSKSLYSNTTGGYNTAVGYQALFSNATASANTASGTQSLFSNTTGVGNSAFGHRSLYTNTIGELNTAIGWTSLQYNSTGNHNTALGSLALESNTTGSSNTAIGFQGLWNNSTGSGNTAVGNSALFWAGGNHNSGIGAGTEVWGGDNSTAIGYGAEVHGSNKIRLGNADITVIEGQVAFSFPSDARFKYNIKHDVPGLDFITRLKPVTYFFDTEKLEQYTRTGRVDEANIRRVSYTGERQLHTGFLAQDVEQVAKELGYDFDGIHAPQNSRDHYSLAYSQFIMPLVKAVQEQQIMIRDVQLQNKKLEELIREQQEQSARLLQEIASLQQQIQEHVKK